MAQENCNRPLVLLKQKPDALAPGFAVSVVEHTRLELVTPTLPV